MTKRRSTFRRRKNGPNNDHVFAYRGFWNTFGRNPAAPNYDRSVSRHEPGETGRQLAARLRAAAAPDPADKPKRVRPSRAKVQVAG